MSAQNADTREVQDQPCGCRLGGMKDRLCPYHEGWQDGWDACWEDNVGTWSPAEDARASAGDIRPMPDPYKEAARRKARASRCPSKSNDD